MGIKFDNEVFALIVLASLLESWETLKISLTNSAPNGVVDMELVKSGILNEEMRRRSKGASSTQSDILAVSFRGRSETRNSKSNHYANIECHYSKKKGHIKNFCRKLKNDQDKNKGKDVSKDDSSDDDDETNFLGEFC